MDTKYLERLLWWGKAILYEIVPHSEPDLYRLAKRNSPGAKTCFDVGANRGTTVQRMLDLWDTDVYAFDAGQSQINSLSKRFAGNPRVHIFMKCLSDKNASVQFQHSTQSPELSSIHQRLINKPKDIILQEMVTERLDTVIKELGIVPDILKVDTEGHDATVLKGLGNYIRSIPVIIAEVIFNKIYEGQDTWLQVMEILHQTHDLQGINTSRDENDELEGGNVVFFLRK